jgi:hypothetical protein
MCSSHGHLSLLREANERPETGAPPLKYQPAAQSGQAWAFVATTVPYHSKRRESPAKLGAFAGEVVIRRGVKRAARLDQLVKLIDQPFPASAPRLFSHARID